MYDKRWRLGWVLCECRVEVSHDTCYSFGGVGTEPRIGKELASNLVHRVGRPLGACVEELVGRYTEPCTQAYERREIRLGARLHSAECAEAHSGVRRSLTNRLLPTAFPDQLAKLLDRDQVGLFDDKPQVIGLIVRPRHAPECISETPTS